MADDRATRLDREFPGFLLHLYGHVHTFDVSQRGGTTYANVSALDRLLPVRRKRRGRRLSYVNAGNYAVIEVRDNGAVAVECRLLAPTTAEGLVSRGPPAKRLPGGELIPEDRIFGDNIRFPQGRAMRSGRRCSRPGKVREHSQLH